MSEISGADIEKVIAGVKRAIKAAQKSESEKKALNIEKLELTLKAVVEPLQIFVIKTVYLLTFKFSAVKYA